MSISALIVDARCILAQQELDQLQVFSVGARTATQDEFLVTTSERHQSRVKGGARRQSMHFVSVHSLSGLRR